MQLRPAPAAALSAAAWLAAGTVHADDPPRVESASRVAVYQDNDRTTVWTATTGVTGRVTDHLQVSARYLVDAVSSASVDVVSQATGRFHDTRQEVSGSVGYRDDRRSLLATYSHSAEDDWRSHNAALSASQDLLGHSLTLAAALGAQTNAISRAHSIGFSRGLRAYFGNLSIDYALTARDLVEAALAVSFLEGFQSSPYRYLVVDGQAILENYPDRRWREALVLRHHHYFDPGWALRSHGRAYTDTYGVRALTLGTEAVRERPPFDVGIAIRGYAQTDASFYKPQYTTVERHMSRDKELTRFVNLFAGPSVGLTRERMGPFQTLRIDARLSAFYFRYFDFPALRERHGIFTDVGLSASF